MFKSWNLSVVLLAALLAASCGSDNDTGDKGSGGFLANGAPVTSSDCNPGKTAPSSVSGDWNAFKQHVYNCNFDYIIDNSSSYSNNYNYNYGNYGNNSGYYNYGNYAMMPLTAEYVYSTLRCDQWSGCYSVGSNYVTVGLNQNDGGIHSITDFRFGSQSQASAHSRLKSLVLNVTDVRKVYEKAFEFSKNGRVYIIDLEWPMVANPVSDKPLNAETTEQNGYQISSERHF